jgi:nitronate monooxygenase
LSAPSAGGFLAELRLESPVVQAGMAGGVAGGQLAGAVSAAGGLGTVGIMAPGAFARALADARRRAPHRPVAANLLLPFVRQAHVTACVEAGVALVVLHGGLSRRWVSRMRNRGLVVFVTVGTPAQASAALAAGASGLVAQGSEAGGHVVGVEPIEQALPRVLDVAGDAPVLAAGGVAGAEDVRGLLRLGAAAAIAGTRFLLTEESAAHEEYKQRVVGAQRTLATLLFGIGWPLLHRVIPNAATERWCGRDELGPRLGRVASQLSAPLGRLTPIGAMRRLVALQQAGLPLFSPALPLDGMATSTVDCCALYAGETVRRLHDVTSAREAVEQLTPA